MANKYVIVGWLGGNSEIFVFDDMKKGKQTAEELPKSPVWKPVWHGSVIDLITELEGRGSWSKKINEFMKLYDLLDEASCQDLRDCLATLETLAAIAVKKNSSRTG